MLQSVMRTGVPIVYAILIKLGVGNLGVGNQVITDVATVILAVVLYALLRAAEALEPKLGVLLGWVGAPKYGKQATTTIGTITAEVHTKMGQSLDDALADLRDDLGDLIESKVTTAVRAALPVKPTGRKAPAKKPTPAP